MSKMTVNDGKVLSYFVLDVFSAKRLAGNALAVVINPGLLTPEMMQAIARETNLSETTFVERRDSAIEKSEGVRVRIFTTEEELPFAGHPTLGTASLLRTIAPECVVNDVVTLALNVGPVKVKFEPRADVAPEWPVKGEMTQRDPEFGAILDAEEVAHLTGLSVEELDSTAPVQAVSTGTGFAIVALKSANSLARLRVRQDESGAYLRARGARWFYVLGPEDDSAAGSGAAGLVWRARMQFNGGEDPATGSAAGCAISHLVRYGLVKPDVTIHVRQGIEILRPSDLYLTAGVRESITNGNLVADSRQVTNVRVGGSTVLVAKGELFLS